MPAPDRGRATLPSSSGLGRGPLKAETRVRLPLGAPTPPRPQAPLRGARRGRSRAVTQPCPSSRSPSWTASSAASILELPRHHRDRGDRDRLPARRARVAPSGRCGAPGARQRRGRRASSATTRSAGRARRCRCARRSPSWRRCCRPGKHRGPGRAERAHGRRVPGARLQGVRACRWPFDYHVIDLATLYYAWSLVAGETVPALSLRQAANAAGLATGADGAPRDGGRAPHARDLPALHRPARAAAPGRLPTIRRPAPPRPPSPRALSPAARPSLRRHFASAPRSTRANSGSSQRAPAPPGRSTTRRAEVDQHRAARPRPTSTLLRWRRSRCTTPRAMHLRERRLERGEEVGRHRLAACTRTGVRPGRYSTAKARRSIAADASAAPRDGRRARGRRAARARASQRPERARTKKPRGAKSFTTTSARLVLARAARRGCAGCPGSGARVGRAARGVARGGALTGARLSRPRRPQSSRSSESAAVALLDQRPELAGAAAPERGVGLRGMEVGLEELVELLGRELLRQSPAITSGSRVALERRKDPPSQVRCEPTKPSRSQGDSLSGSSAPARTNSRFTRYRPERTASFERSIRREIS